MAQGVTLAQVHRHERMHVINLESTSYRINGMQQSARNVYLEK